MISNVAIENYKSVRKVEFEARRINVFIGEPNSGKSNLLEALSLFSEGVHEPSVFKEVFRFNSTSELFFDQNIGDEIRVRGDELSWTLSFSGDEFLAHFSRGGPGRDEVRIRKDGSFNSWINPQVGCHTYRFKADVAMTDSSLGALQSPFGRNLPTLITTNKKLRREIVDVFNARGFKFIVKPTESELEIAKEVDGEFFAYPYQSVSETLRRIVFYKAALGSNEDSILLFDEPEAQTFPVFTKELAESVALSVSNQFFITTHNPYLLASLVQKTPLKELAVNVVHMDDFETKVKRMSDGKLGEIQELGSSVFFNLERLLMD